jgi:hypothetical protein
MPYRQKLPLSPLFKKFLDGIPREKVRSVDFLVALNQKLPRTSATPSAWSRACRRRKKRWNCSPAPAAIRPGCWCSCCATWGWRRASCPAT